METFGYLHILIIFLSIYFLNAQQLQLKTKHPNDDPLSNEIADHVRHQVIEESKQSKYGIRRIIQIPKRIDVLIKRTDLGVSYVDHVYKPRYYAEELKNYSQLDCGITDFEVVVNYCDCHEICNVYRNTKKRQSIPTRFVLNYDLFMHTHNNSLYFSTAINDERVENGNSSVNMPKNLMNHGNANKFFGPVRMTDLAEEVFQRCNATNSNGTQTWPELDFGRPFLERAIKEWALYENTDYYYKQYIWKHQSGELPDTGRDEMKIHVTLFPGYFESFNRLECLQLNETHNFSPANLTVNKGGCVKIYDGFGCTGATQIVFQEHVRLYSQSHVRQPVISRIKSMSSCCPGFPKESTPPYLFKSQGAGQQRTRKSANLRIDCSCPCSETPPSSTTTRSPNVSRQTPVKEHERYNAKSLKLCELLRINATAALAMEVSMARAVAVALEDSPEASVAAIVDAAITAEVVSEMAYRTLALIESSPEQKVRGLYVRRLVEDVASSTAMSAKYASKATPETASELALDLALETLCAQAFIADAILQVISNSNKLSKSFKRRSKIRTKKIEAPVGEKVSSGAAEEGGYAQKGERKSGENEEKKFELNGQTQVVRKEERNVSGEIEDVELHRSRTRRHLLFLSARL